MGSLAQTSKASATARPSEGQELWCKEGRLIADNVSYFAFLPLVS